MAADLLTDVKGGKEFMERLRSSFMLEIKCRDSFHQPITVRVPEALACSVSTRISTLVGTGHNKRREISIEELLGGHSSYLMLEEHLTPDTGRTILDYVTWFIQWMYTARLNYNKNLRFFEMWLFASKMGCPKLQNEAKKKRQYYFANHDFAQDLFYCAGYFTGSQISQKDGFDKDRKLEVSYWENKKCWLFLLDCAAYFGPGDRRVRSIYVKSEALEVQIIKRMIELAKEGGDPCPWEASNIARYVVVESVRRCMVSPVGSMLPPRRKHALSP